MAKRRPLRSARVEIAEGWLDAAAVGAPVSFDLGAGLVAEGEFVWAHREDTPGVKVYAGTLHNPQGMFFIEKNRRGWAGSFRLTDSKEIVQIMPDRHEPGVTRLELWPEKETVCASADTDGDPATPPPADPSLEHTNLHSRPGSEHCIYLDFNGETVSGTQWNVFYNSFNDIVVQPSGLSREEIIGAWARAAEDWIIFDVDVTTSRTTYNNTAAECRAMVVCTPTGDWYWDNEGTGSGGVATLDSFNNLVTSATCWNFNVGNYLASAETISHEAAHTMGNSHASWESASGYTEVEYYRGHETDCGIAWAPIMGNSFFRGVDTLTQFSNGWYGGADNDEDQLDEIAYELDKIGDTSSILLPTGLTMSGDSKKVKGLMDSGGDVDSYLIELDSGGWIVSVEPNPCGPNVDCELALRRFPDDSLVARQSNAQGARETLSASVTVPDAGGLFRINIASDSCIQTDVLPDPYNIFKNGYSNYGGVGSYTLTIKRPPGFESNPPVVAGVNMSTFHAGATYCEAEVIFRDASQISTFFSGTTTITLERTTGGVTLTGAKVGTVTSSTDDSGTTPLNFKKRRFRFAAPGGYWDAAEAGSYRVRFPAGSVADEHANAIPVTTVNVGSLTPDTEKPQIATKITPKNLAEGENDPVDIEFIILDESPVTVASNGAGVFEAVSTSGAPTIPLQRISYTKEDGGRNWRILCRALPPGGTWDDAEAGVWNVQVKPAKISDVAGNAPNATHPTWAFTVTASLFFQNFQAEAGAHGFTLDTGWEHGLTAGEGLPYDDPQNNSSRVLGFQLSGSRMYTDLMPQRFATSPTIDTTGFEKLTLRYRRHLTLRVGDQARIEVNDATTTDAWTTVWSAPSDRNSWDRTWTTHEVTLPAFVANGALHVRWVMGSTDAAGVAGGWNIDDVEILAAGTWQPGQIVLGLPLLVILQEGGGSLSYTVRLNQQPFLPVTVNLIPSADLTVDDASIGFTSANWSIPRTVTLTAVNDRIVEGTEIIKLRHTCSTFDGTFSGVTRELNVGVLDNDDSIIATQPADAALLPGDGVTLRVVPERTVIGATYQWYRGLRTGRGAAITGATSSSLRVTLDPKATGPEYYFVRVAGGGVTENSRQVVISPLDGEAAFNAELLAMGYTQAQIDAPGFDDLDPDKNGLSHFAEYALGLLPGDAPLWITKVEAGPGDADNPDQIDLFVTLPPLQAGVRYLVESSGDGNSWAVVAELAGDYYTNRSVVVRVPGHGSPNLFARLHMTPEQ